MCIRISLDQEVDHNDPGEISDGDDDVVELAPWRWKNIYDMVQSIVTIARYFIVSRSKDRCFKIAIAEPSRSFHDLLRRTGPFPVDLAGHSAAFRI